MLNNFTDYTSVLNSVVDDSIFITQMSQDVNSFVSLLNKIMVLLL